MAVFANGKIEAHVGPPGLGAADDLEAVIVDFIAGARSKLSRPCKSSTRRRSRGRSLAASWRGVHVELFLEQEVDSAECEALAKRMKAEVERIIASSKTYTP